ncbi:hypothetical protein GS399_04895 [Pedobacter sp. HMF7647]|uniref:Uncharacterized protein n=1 Tax=Hufsiella arboris TaxID=2695275 RepID=A0A7K1Y782_9SPHI|nr:hypothetical protein [Hufsiella arboris]MXV50300.1 hypothetical protein [Hufsiella arboris]
MTLYEFIQADTDQKALAVWNGIYIADRQEGRLRMQLYHLGSFYVEVVYDVPQNRILHFKPFRKGLLLAPYLEQIRLSF